MPGVLTPHVFVNFACERLCRPVSSIARSRDVFNFGMATPLIVIHPLGVSLRSVSNLAQPECMILGVWLSVLQTFRRLARRHYVVCRVLSVLQARQIGLVGRRDSII